MLPGMEGQMCVKVEMCGSVERHTDACPILSPSGGLSVSLPIHLVADNKAREACVLTWVFGEGTQAGLGSQSYFLLAACSALIHVSAFLQCHGS